MTTNFVEHDHPRHSDGKFSEKAQAEAAGVTLTVVRQEERKSIAAQRLEELIDLDDFMNLSEDAARMYRDRYDQARKSNTVDDEDIAQETRLAVLTALHRGNKVTDIRRHTVSTAANITVRNTENKFRAEDRKAYRIYAELRAAKEAEEGRKVTPTEDDAIAQFVLENWHDKRRMPSKEFRIARTVDTSLDRPLGADSDTTLGTLLEAPSSTGHWIEPDSWLDQTFSALEEKGADKKAFAKRAAHNAFAEIHGGVLVTPGTLSQRKVTEYRGVMEKHQGGVLGACALWSGGDDDDHPAVKALFAPYGEDVSTDDQIKIVDFYERFDDAKATQMWEAAASLANNKHADKDK